MRLGDGSVLGKEIGDMDVHRLISYLPEKPYYYEHLTGMELLQQLKQNPAMSDIPIVLVSSSVGVGRSHVFAERDADICVGKPFTRRQILEAIRAAMKTRTVVAPRKLAS